MELQHEWLKRMGFGGRPEHLLEGREAGVESPLTKSACQPQGAQGLRGYQRRYQYGWHRRSLLLSRETIAVDEGFFYTFYHLRKPFIIILGGQTYEIEQR